MTRDKGIELDEAALARLGQAIVDVINECIATTAQIMSGEPVDDVESEILRRIEAEGVTYTPGPEIRQNAELIAEGRWGRP